MGNTRKIQTITVWSPSGEKSIDTLSLTNFFDYHFDDGGGKIEYKLISSNELNGATDVYISIIEIPSDIIQQWGSSDDIIWDYVGEQLGVVFI